MIEVYKKHAENMRLLHWRFYSALSAFKIFEAFKKLKSPPHAGKKGVFRNLKILNRFKYFFSLTEEATRSYFFIELAKFFDPDHRTLSIKKLLGEIAVDLPNFGKIAFLEYRNSIGSPVLEELQKDYRPPKHSDLKRWNLALKKIDKISSRLWKYRSQWLAHDDLEKLKFPITRAELKKVFSTLDRILNQISLKIDFSRSTYINAQLCERDTKQVIRFLTEVTDNP